MLRAILMSFSMSEVIDIILNDRITVEEDGWLSIPVSICSEEESEQVADALFFRDWDGNILMINPWWWNPGLITMKNVDYIKLRNTPLISVPAY